MPKTKPALTILAAPESIQIRGARQNNLKGFDLDLPLGKLIVVTGPSGSGKSSLAFDTVYAEGQRRYVETFSPYTRQFLDRMDKPRVDEIRGIPPAIAIEQSNNVKSTRSTVGTMTDVNDYLKLLFPRIADAFCPDCKRPIHPETAKSIVEQIMSGPRETRKDVKAEPVLITFAVAVPEATKPADFFAFLQQQGYLRVWLDGAIVRTDEAGKIKRLPGKLSVIQDRIAPTEDNRTRLTEAVETALRLGSGKIVAGSQPFSTGWHCAHCDIDILPPSPGLFSFNNPLGACPKCRGFGRTIAIDLPRSIPDRSVSIAAGCIKPFNSENGKLCQNDLLRCCKAKKINLRTPFEDLPADVQEWVFHGEDWDRGTKRSGEELGNENLWYGVAGYFRWLESKAYKMHVRVLLSRYRNYTECPDCRGTRYQPGVLNYRFAKKTLPELQQLPLGELHALLSTATLSDSTSEMLLAEVRSRIGFMVQVGLAYLSLDRPTKTLSGGEAERVNLTTCLGANLVNTLFVLDEPSIGLHPRDTGRLIGVMKSLRDKGNTLLVVEHEESVMRAADHVIELGPGRGEKGGSLVFAGTVEEMTKPERKRDPSLTAAYLTGTKSIPIPNKRRRPAAWLKLTGASEHNLQKLDVEIPLGVFACVTGVSGSGKSTLVHSVLYENLLRAKSLASENPAGALKKLTGHEQISSVVLVDQSPLSRTPKSTPAVYLGVFEHIRERFACTEQALSEGLNASAFSFNGGPGRCERCSGSGFEKIEMQFLSDVFVRCPECEGRRYQPHILRVKLAGKNITEVLDLTVTESIVFFEKLGAPKITRPLQILEEVGLGYLTLGQPLNILSGGESQRLKLVERLVQASKNAPAKTIVEEASRPLEPLGGSSVQRKKGRPSGSQGAETAPLLGVAGALLILDEPTTGLHFDDIALLLRVFERLVQSGYSLIVIEHNVEVIKCADYVIDLGPEAGAGGGLVIATGTPEQVARCPESHTGRFLRHVLSRSNKLSGAKSQLIPTPDHLTSAGDDLSTPPSHSYPSADGLSEPTSDLYPSANRLIPSRDGLYPSPSHLIPPPDDLIDATTHLIHGKSHLIPTKSHLTFRWETSGCKTYDATTANPDLPDSDSGESSARAAEEPANYGAAPLNSIAIYGAREHNLKNISLTIPRGELVVITGLSGSGISTLAFDILFAEGQRRFLDVMSPYARQFVEQLEKPDVDLITGLPPSVAIEQRITRGGGKSTVATVTEVYHFLRLLFSKLGTQHCPDCHCAVEKQTANAVARKVETLGKRGKLRLFATLVKARKGFHTDVAKWAKAHGYTTLLVDGELRKVDTAMKLERFVEHTIEVLIGETTGSDCDALVKAALAVGKGTIRVMDAKNKSTVMSTERACPECGVSFEELDPRMFSFNSPHGWCPECRGFGEVWKQSINPRLETALEQELDIERQSEALERGEAQPCSACEGARLNRISCAVQIGGVKIADFVAHSVEEAASEITAFKFTAAQKPIARDIVPEIAQRLTFMGKVGLGYLALNRSARTLSGGESQRIRLSAQLGSNLRGVLYVLDEPTIGLHPRDNAALLDTLDALRAKGNSLIVVEHDEDTLRRADHILDLGPGAGIHGGEVIAQGTLAQITANRASTTGNSLREPLQHPTRGKRRSLAKADWLELRNATVNNLKNITVKFPIAKFTVITGISGSGKSTLMRSALKPAVEEALKGKRKLKGIEHLEAIREVDQSPIGKTTRSTPATYLGIWDAVRALFAQLPTARMRGYTPSRFSFNTEGGRCETCAGQGVIKLEMAFLPTSYHPCTDCHGARFNPATLEVLYDGKSIGDILNLPLSEAAEFFKAHPKIHRPLALLCDTGLGYLKLGQPSPTLSGGEAQRMKLVYELALGIAHDANERMRKMKQPKSTLYLLEEPTIGLHMRDVAELLKVLHRLVDSGATVIVIEHNLTLIADADHVIDIGPEAGKLGGEVVATGTPEEIAKHPKSRTGPYLKSVLR